MDIVKHFRLTHDPFKAGSEREFGDGDATVLSHEDARRFIATRTAVAGRTDLFSPAALDVIASSARGRPAALRLLAGNAMFHAAFDGARRIEETHARQAAATQDIWRDVPPPDPAPAAGAAVAAPPVVALTPAPIAAEPAPPPVVEPRPMVAPAAVAVAPAAYAARPVEVPVDDDVPARRGWWRNAPPLARLAIVVGLFLLSLPVIGYVIGAVKDQRPTADSSYLPDEGEIADAEAPIDAAPELPPVDASVPGEIEVADASATTGEPEDLTAQTIPADVPALPPAREPVAVGAGEAAVPTPQREPEPAPAPEPAPEPAVERDPEPEPAPADTSTPGGDAPRVFVHYSTRQSDGADVASSVARRLRAQGFEVVDIRAVPMSIETASVRYFYSADRAAAEALHDALGGALRPRGYSAGDLKSMTGYERPPRRGTLEVWVPAG